jgi:hypothetical protein
MARFYDPRAEKADQPVDTPVGYRGRVQYDPRQDSGSSGGEVTDLTPERQYDVDLRRLGQDSAPTAAAADTENSVQQSRVSRFLSASRIANKYKQQADIRYPNTGSSTRRNPASRQGVTLPSLGEAPGAGGNTNYPNKPQPRSGKPYNWRDSFG